MRGRVILVLHRRWSLCVRISSAAIVALNMFFPPKSNRVNPCPRPWCEMTRLPAGMRGRTQARLGAAYIRGVLWHARWACSGMHSST